MKSVDRIIRYLSGDLTPEQSGSFREELENNPSLREEYDQVSAAYRLIGDQIRRMDEAAFRSTLERVMEKREVRTDRRSDKKRPRWYFLLPVAASFAILLAVYVLNQRQDRIYREFLDPAGDPVLLALSQRTRNATGSAMDLYTRGNYRTAYEKAAEVLSNDSGDRMALLIQLLAAMELDMEWDTRVMADDIVTDTMDVVGQALTWYHVIALLKTHREKEALKHLDPLLEQAGPYHSDAHKLEKMLKK